MQQVVFHSLSIHGLRIKPTGKWRIVNPFRVNCQPAVAPCPAPPFRESACRYHPRG
jgi:hypothetical protein